MLASQVFTAETKPDPWSSVAPSLALIVKMSTAITRTSAHDAAMAAMRCFSGEIMVEDCSKTMAVPVFEKAFRYHVSM
ncbi:MAG: hypothetical protein ACLRX5_05325 [Slackia sp.]